MTLTALACANALPRDYDREVPNPTYVDSDVDESRSKRGEIRNVGMSFKWN
jgi:hypothetical protein